MNKSQYYSTMARLMGPHADPEEFYTAFPFAVFKDATPGDLINAVHQDRRSS
jgi:hypothetical protein